MSSFFRNMVEHKQRMEEKQFDAEQANLRARLDKLYEALKQLDGSDPYAERGPDLAHFLEAKRAARILINEERAHRECEAGHE